MMTEKRIKMEKKEISLDKSAALLKKNEKRNKKKKSKQMRKKRLIIRNLSFKVSEEKLKDIFSEYGEVIEARIPLTKEGKKRGFAFIQYKDTKSQIKAMKTLNFKKIDGRPIAIDFAVDKTTYQSRMQDQKSSTSSYTAQDLKSEQTESDLNDVKSEPQSDTSDDEEVGDNEEAFDKDDDDDKITFLKKFGVDDDNSVDSGESSKEEESDEETESHHSDETSSYSDYVRKKKQSQDISEGKTVFIRNISFKNSEEDLQEIMEEFGKTEYCLLCMDPLTDHPKGTAFVKFKEKLSADKLITESSKEPGLLLDGRRLLCSYALSREELSLIHNQSTKVKDRRNLGLLKCGVIMQDSKEAEGISQSDMAKRTQLEMMKKKKLKNVNFFVSDKRLAIHNLPKNITDKDIRIMFKNAAGKEAVIKEARIMRDFKKTDAQGMPVSRGFGFVCFTEHEHALKALTELNNNPNIFTSQKRPIVEFSVENKVALLSQERKREKIQMRNKKRTEAKLTSHEDPSEIEEKTPYTYKVTPNKKNKKRKNKGNNSPNKKMKQISSDLQSPDKTETKSPKKKQRKRFRNKNKKEPRMNNQDNSLSQLANKYKEKLLNKFS